jgi:hypothetical protein
MTYWICKVTREGGGEVVDVAQQLLYLKHLNMHKHR